MCEYSDYELRSDIATKFLGLKEEEDDELCDDCFYSKYICSHSGTITGRSFNDHVFCVCCRKALCHDRRDHNDVFITVDKHRGHIEDDPLNHKAICIKCATNELNKVIIRAQKPRLEKPEPKSEEQTEPKPEDPD